MSMSSEISDTRSERASDESCCCLVNEEVGITFSNTLISTMLLLLLLLLVGVVVGVSLATDTDTGLGRKVLVMMLLLVMVLSAVMMLLF